LIPTLSRLMLRAGMVPRSRGRHASPSISSTPPAYELLPGLFRR